MEARTRVVVPAAGKATRICSSLPGCAGSEEIAKALLKLGEEPIIARLLRVVRDSGIDPCPIVVVSEVTGGEIRQALGACCEYVIQNERLGTAHAVACTKEILCATDAIMVIYSDMPFIRSVTLRAIVETRAKESVAVTMGTVTVKDFRDWRGCFATYGRVLRDGSGEVMGIVELKDASPAQKGILEVSPSFFCFGAEWLWANLSKVGRENAQREYYLTDLVGIAIREGNRVCTVPVCPIEAVGINTLEELALAEKLTN
jgi:bifunctional UDP-N-acetylglucosamine pyrophosphorylase/glucosamine-1-phosphate N-acetyltransferase